MSTFYDYMNAANTAEKVVLDEKPKGEEEVVEEVVVETPEKPVKDSLTEYLEGEDEKVGGDDKEEVAAVAEVVGED